MITTSEVGELLAGDSESDRVTRWRLEQFAVLGFELGDALLLSVSPADLEVARKLVRSGCDPEIAAQILL
jgi:hypothetical protein